MQGHRCSGHGSVAQGAGSGVRGRGQAAQGIAYIIYDTLAIQHERELASSVKY